MKLFSLLLYRSRAFVIVPLILLRIETCGQISQCGVYLTSRDYEAGRLAHANPCDHNHKLKLNEFLGQRFITIDIKGASTKLSKDSIFAVLTCDGHAHRFYQHYDHDYIIEENKSVIIYEREINLPYGKGFRTELKYFFSATPDGEIVALTTENIKAAFLSHHDLADAIDEHFPGGEGITGYDPYAKMFKINIFLANHLR